VAVVVNARMLRVRTVARAEPVRAFAYDGLLDRR